MEEPILNEAKKDYHRPMHTAEHILNQTMVRMFGCERSKNSHIERKKSKCDYFIDESPDQDKINEIEARVNAQIKRSLDIKIDFVNRKNVPAGVDLSKLPENASETLRIVYVGDYDVCACIGEHVNNTSEIGEFKIISSDYNEGRLRVRFKLENCPYSE
jgi:misacylated tRNA(Ala) deacylase